MIHATCSSSNIKILKKETSLSLDPNILLISLIFSESFVTSANHDGGPRSYNLIPDYMRHVQSIHFFKSMLKNWIASIPRYQVHQYIDVKNIYYGTK
ncbi:unnamed protein product [Callosobruchus maculatus]|uniref:Uncharacterized protein n=1 Tax=Callosobruchus maculatus TaxID=64391 RepID=A0A653D1C9_CALMS|nr:unnamed protein product [Callosobruchus maculatus]